MRPFPKVSVLIPTYNYARFLPQAIESVLAQDFTDFELLVCDDHSADSTAEVLRRYAGRDPRLQTEIHPANLGMVNNWNYCLAQARGEFVKFLFGDDTLADPSALGKLVRMLESSRTVRLAACARKVLDDQSRRIDVWRTLRDGLHSGRDVIVRCLMAHANLIGEPSAVLFRKFHAGPGFDPAYRQIVDMELWFRLLEQGDLAYTREPLCGFRRHAGQQTARNDAEGVAWAEHLAFAAAWAEKPWVPRKALFPIVFEFRRSARKHRGMRTPELAAAEQRLAARLGKAWYWPYWIRHRLVRPLQNVAHSIEKRTRRRNLS